MKRLATLLKSKAVWGAVLTAGAWLLNQDHVGVHEVVEAVGGVLSAAGLRDGIAKLGVAATGRPT